MVDNVASLIRLMLVTDDRLVTGRSLVDLAQAAEAGGVTAVQLRLKQASPARLLALAKELISAVSIPVLVNDRPDVALAAGAAGVHLGPEDLPIDLARRIAPPGFLIGASVGSEAEAAAAGAADYWGIGPWRVTTTKHDAGPALGAEGFRHLVTLAGGKPCIAIGSVLATDVSAVLAAGGVGVAAASGILERQDVTGAAGEYRKLLDRGARS